MFLPSLTATGQVPGTHTSLQPVPLLTRNTCLSRAFSSKAGAGLCACESMPGQGGDTQCNMCCWAQGKPHRVEESTSNSLLRWDPSVSKPLVPAPVSSPGSSRGMLMGSQNNFGHQRAWAPGVDPLCDPPPHLHRDPRGSPSQAGRQGTDQDVLPTKASKTISL